MNLKNFIKTRIKNYALWVSLIAFIGIIINLKYPSFKGQYDVLSNAFLGILIVAGIVSNPTTQNKGFSDDI